MLFYRLHKKFSVTFMTHALSSGLFLNSTPQTYIHNLPISPEAQSEISHPISWQPAKANSRRNYTPIYLSPRGPARVAQIKLWRARRRACLRPRGFPEARGYTGCVGGKRPPQAHAEVAVGLEFPGVSVCGIYGATRAV